MNSLKNNDFEAQVEFTLKVTERARDVTVKKDCLLVYALKFFGILAGRCGSGKEERLR